MMPKPVFFEKSAAILLVLALFLLTLWRFGTNQCLAILALMVLFYRPWRQTLFSKQWLKTPVILVSLIFIALCLIGVTYSEAPTIAKALQGITAYSKLLFLLILPLALQNTKYHKWFENALIYGVLVNVIISTLYYYQIPWAVQLFGPHMSMQITYTVNPLQVVYIVVMALWLLMTRLANREFTVPNILSFVLLLGYLWLINMERSGYLLFLALVLLFLGQQFGKKATIIGCIILPLLCDGLYFAVPNIKARVDMGIHNITAFQQASSVMDIGVDNSWGLRVAFAKESWEVIKDHPVLGTGTGSFRYVYAEKYPTQAETVKINDPHNAYVYVAFEFGLIGLIVYLAWLYAIWMLTTRLALRDRHLLRGIWLIFVVMGFTDSGLPLNAIGISFVVWISIYLARDLHAHRTHPRL